MVKVKLNGSCITYNSFEFHESTEMFSSEVLLYTNEDIPSGSKISIESDTKVDLVQVSGVRSGSDNVYTLYPEGYWNILNRVYPCVSGSFNTQDLLTKLGISVAKGSCRTSSIVWDMPSLKWKSLCKHLQDFTNPTSGAGAYIYVDLYGKVRIGDYKSDYQNNNSAIITGSLEDLSISVDWVNYFPGKVNLKLFTEKGEITKDLVIKEGYGYGSFTKVIQSDKIETIETCLRNEFYRNYYKSQKVQLVNCPMTTLPSIGTKVNLNGKKSYYVIDEYTASFNQGVNPVIKLTLIAPPHE